MIELLAAWMIGDSVCVSTDPCVAPAWYVLRLDGEDVAANPVEPLFMLTPEIDPSAEGMYEYRVATIDDQGRQHHGGEPYYLCVGRSALCWPGEAETDPPWICEPERDQFVACCQAAGGCG